MLKINFFFKISELLRIGKEGNIFLFGTEETFLEDDPCSFKLFFGAYKYKLSVLNEDVKVKRKLDLVHYLAVLYKIRR